MYQTMESQQSLLGAEPRRSSITERLIEEKKKLSNRLNQVEKVLLAIDKNPEIAEVVNLISKLY